MGKGKGEREMGKGYGTRDMGIWDMVCRKGHVGTWEGITYPVNGCQVRRNGKRYKERENGRGKSMRETVNYMEVEFAYI